MYDILPYKMFQTDNTINIVFYKTFFKYMFAILGSQKSENQKVPSYYGYAQDLPPWKVLSVTDRMWNIEQNMLKLLTLEYTDKKNIPPYFVSVQRYPPSVKIPVFYRVGFQDLFSTPLESESIEFREKNSTSMLLKWLLCEIFLYLTFNSVCKLHKYFFL